MQSTLLLKTRRNPSSAMRYTFVTGKVVCGRKMPGGMKVSATRKSSLVLIAGQRNPP